MTPRKQYRVELHLKVDATNYEKAVDRVKEFEARAERLGLRFESSRVTGQDGER